MDEFSAERFEIVTREERFRKEFSDALKRNSQIDAIKAYRAWKNVGLKKAYDKIIPQWEELKARPAAILFEGDEE